MSAPVDIGGRRFGRLVAIERRGSIGRQAAWLCRCDCGEIKTLPGKDLRSGHTTSCGCYRTTSAQRLHTTHGNARLLSPKTAEYRAWCGMVDRCEREANKSFPEYGGRGVKVCDRWRASFALFLEDMGHRPSPRHSVDRIDVNGHYEPSNCRWATYEEQNRNRRNTVRLTVDGVERPLVEWADAAGLSRQTVWNRIRAGWEPRKAVSQPSRNRRSA